MERKRDAKLLYFGEIHEKIEVFNLVIDPSVFVSDEEVASVRLTIDKQGLSFLSGKRRIDVPFREFTIEPLSAQTAKIVNERELHIRLKLTTIQEFTSENSQTQLDDLVSKSGEKQVLNIGCKKCHSDVTHCNRTYSRVLELPSENWQEYLDNWCCHGNEAITKLKDGLNPREHDCFLGDWYILIHPEALNSQNVEVVKKEENHLILCQRCQATLGKLNFSAVDASGKEQCKDIDKSISAHLYKHSISCYWIADAISKDLFNNFGEEMFLARNFISLTKTRMCHKFIVNKTLLIKHKKDSSLVLIWILKTDTKFFSSLCNANEREEIKGLTNPFSAVKVLYKTYLDDQFQRLKDEWYGNAHTDIISFPDEICLKLLCLLHENNMKQPPSLRSTNGYKVSFLRL
mgnify:CR=1 FL=1